jgi:small subunit ribosomal protein S13
LARIVGVDLPREKCISVALTYIYGIGMTTSKKILAKAQIEETVRVKNLTEEEVSKIRQAIESQDIKTEGDLRKERAMNVRRLMDINCYRGQRHKRGMPVRGQRTHTNARTWKGPRPSKALRKKK